MAKCECLLRVGLVTLTLMATSLAWKCLYEEFKLDPEKVSEWRLKKLHTDRIWFNSRCKAAGMFMGHIRRRFPCVTLKIVSIIAFKFPYKFLTNKLKLIFLVDPYWTRITHTDYTSFAVELHCSLPWMRPQMVIYTRDKKPSEDILKAVDDYLSKVNLKRDKFVLIKKTKGCKDAKHSPLQRWHLSSYNHLEYHPHYVKPLAQNPNI